MTRLTIEVDEATLAYLQQQAYEDMRTVEEVAKLILQAKRLYQELVDCEQA